MLKELRQQHAIDLNVYRSAHQNIWNRRLHHVMIPLEVASFQWLLTTLLLVCHAWVAPYSRRFQPKQTKFSGSFMAYLGTSVACTMGFLSAVVASDPWIGLLVLVWHIGTAETCLWGVTHFGLYKSLWLGVSIWIISWGLQICVGHYWVERKPPNIFNPDDEVSILSTLTSIVLAWEC